MRARAIPRIRISGAKDPRFYGGRAWHIYCTKCNITTGKDSCWADAVEGAFIHLSMHETKSFKVDRHG